MSLRHMHRGLIAGTIAFNFVFMFFAARHWMTTADPSRALLALGTAVLTLGLVGALVYVNRNLALTRRLLVGAESPGGR